MNMPQVPVKQMTQILSTVNVPKYEPVLVKCLAAHNEEGWIEANLRNNYDEFDIIRVVEGAVEGRPDSTVQGHSTDRTLDIIRAFPDPDNKIELFQAKRFFKSLEEQKQTFIDHSKEGEWLFIVDCDEFYHEGEIDRVREAIKSRPDASEIIPTFLHFYRDIRHVKAPHPEWQPQHQRIIRYQPGMRYHTHPVVTAPDGRCTYFDASYQPKRFTMVDLYIYHYGHAKGKKFHEMKRDFYKSELGKFDLEDGTNASDKFDEKFVEFMEHTEERNTILSYPGLHPMPVEGLPIYDEYEETYEDKEFADWKTDFVYAEEALPTIVLFMMGPWQRMKPFINVIKV